jgi:hypothetical protein
MEDPILARVALAKRESRFLDFKEGFDPARAGDWFEITKDIVAMANSGGGVLVFGVRDNGESCEFDSKIILGLDPAKFTDKLAACTGEQFSNFEIDEVERGKGKVAVIRVRTADFPMVFTIGGNYVNLAGKPKTAFQMGAVYFRHGAKSEPGNASDLRQFIEREVDRHRLRWLGGIKKVVTAPGTHRVEVIGPEMRVTADRDATPVRIVSDRAATSARLLDPDVTHPYRQIELLKALNAEIKVDPPITSYDNLSVRRLHKIDESRPDFYYCSKFGSPQYSEDYRRWLIEQLKQHPSFFANARKAMQKP